MNRHYANQIIKKTVTTLLSAALFLEASPPSVYAAEPIPLMDEEKELEEEPLITEDVEDEIDTLQSGDSTPEESIPPEEPAPTPGKDYSVRFLLTAGDGQFDPEIKAEDDKKLTIHATEDGSFSDFVRFMDTDDDGEDEEISFDELPQPEREGYAFVCYYVTEVKDIEDESELVADLKVTDETLVKDILEREDLTFDEEDEELIVLYPVWLGAPSEDEEPEDVADPAQDEDLAKDKLPSDTEDEDSEDPEPADEEQADPEETTLTLDLSGEEGKDPSEESEADPTADPDASMLLLGGSNPDLLGTQGYTEDPKEGFWIESHEGLGRLEDKTYIGSNIICKNLIVHNGAKVIAPADYSVAYKNNKNVGTATVTVTLKNSYSGKITDTFEIAKADLGIGDGGSYSFEVSGLETPYTGKVQKLQPVVKLKAKDGEYEYEYTLKNGTDYTLYHPSEGEDAYIGSQEGGETYRIDIEGKGNFEGLLSVDMLIRPQNMVSVNNTKVTVTANVEPDANGKEDVKIDEVKVTYGKQPPMYAIEATSSLTEDDYKNNNFIYSIKDLDLSTATGTIEITGTGEFYNNDGEGEKPLRFFGTREVSFKITGTPISKAEITGGPYTYDGLAHEQDVVFDGAPLEKDEKYEVTYKNGRNIVDEPLTAGSYTATYKGINGFTGTVNKTFKINPYKITPNDARFIVELNDEYNYVKGGVKPDPVVKFIVVDKSGDETEETLQPGIDYTLSYANNTQVGNAKKVPTVTVKGKGNFTGALAPIPFTIAKQNLNGDDITVTAADKVFSNKRGNFKTTVTVTDSGKKLVAGTDYKKEFEYYYTQDETTLVDGVVRYENDKVEDDDIVPPGTVLKVVVSAVDSEKCCYQGSNAATFRITGADISKASVRIYPQYYDGDPVTLDYDQIEVKLGGIILNGGEDYEIGSYTNNDRKGSATVTLKGIGDYGGSKTVKYTIAAKTTNFTVIFNGNGSTSGTMKNMTIASGKPPVKLTANKFKRNGYRFTGWKDTNDKPYTDGAEIENTGAVSGCTLILYAQWEDTDDNGNAIEYNINYHLNGWQGNLSDIGNPDKYRVSTDTITLKYPTTWPDGYQFGGWYKDSAYKTKISQIKKGTTGNLDIYAKWVPYTYTVTFDPNGGKGSMATQTFSYGLSKALLPNKFQKTGYRFVGWSTAKDTDDDDRNRGDINYYDKEVVKDLAKTVGIDPENPYTSKVTLYAVWSKEFYINYETNFEKTIDELIDDLYDYDKYTYGKGLALLPAGITRPGYSFGGWFSDAALKKQVKSIAKNASGDMTLYAKWIPNKYTIAFDGDGATGRMGNVSFNSGTTVKIPVNSFTKNGYEFKGWRLDNGEVLQPQSISAEDLLSVAGIDKTENNKTFKLYAIWKEWQPASQEDRGKPYNIVFDKNVPETEAIQATGKMNSQKLVYGTGKKLTKNAFKRKGYIFTGWSLNPEPEATDRIFSDAEYVYGMGNPFENEENGVGTVTLYAIWDIETYKISYVNMDDIDDFDKPDEYNVLGESWVEGAVYTEAGDNIVLQEPSAIGRTFLGWFSNANFRTKFTGIPIGSTGKKTVYAKWQNTQYTVNYVLNADTGSPAELIYDNAGYVNNYSEHFDSGYILATATRAGYVFGGWYSDAACRKYVGYFITNPTSDITVYAKWIPHSYSIKFVKNFNKENLDEPTGTMKDMNSLKVGSSYKLPANAYKHEIFEFVGWKRYDNPDDIPDTVYADDAEVRIDCENRASFLVDAIDDNSVIYLVAAWKPKRFAIRYLETNGTEIQGISPSYFTYFDLGTEISPEVVDAGEDNPDKNPMRYGKTFLGWYYDAKLEKYAGNPAAGTPIKLPDTMRELNLYAKWNIEVPSIQDDVDDCINVQDYGAIPDDGKEDNAKINAAIEAAHNRASAGNSVTVYVPPGEYTIIARDRHSIKLRSYVNLLLDPDAVFHVTERQMVGGVEGMIGINAEHDIIISGGKLKGGKDIYSDNEKGMGINILGSYNITVSNMEICDNWGDGIYIGYTSSGGGCHDIIINNCDIHSNRRNNITITYGDRIRIEGCNIYDAQGTAPQAGVCVEPNLENGTYHVCDDIYIKDTTITTPYEGDWEYRCYHAYNGPNKKITSNVVFDNCTLRGWFSNWFQPHPKFINGTVLHGTYDPGY